VGFLRDPDSGIVMEVVDNPIAAWTPEEWAERIAQLEREIASLREQLDQLPKPKDKPDQETLDFWNQHAAMYHGGDIQMRLMALQAQLDEMLKV